MSDRQYDVPSPAMPDDYDRTLGNLHGLPGMARTKPAMVRVVQPLGVGGSATYSVTTYRQAGDVISEEGEKEKRAPATFTVFLEVARGERLTRIVIPHKVAAILARQREALTAKAARKSAQEAAETRKSLGIVPNFGKAKRA